MRKSCNTFHMLTTGVTATKWFEGEKMMLPADSWGMVFSSKASASTIRCTAFYVEYLFSTGAQGEGPILLRYFSSNG
jgi:hypothetical protein